MNSKSLRTLLAAALIATTAASARAQDDPYYNDRVETLVTQIADSYSPPNASDKEKYYWPKVLARFYKYGTDDATANNLIAGTATRDAYHFAVVGMARLLCQYPEAPQLQQKADAILQVALSKNLTTTEGTENHIAMERTSIFLLAQQALKRQPDNDKARQQYDDARQWILTWAPRVYQQGIGEWNSSTYAPYSMDGWLNLYDFADDEAVRLAAKAVVDYYATEIALHYSWGTLGGTEMRGNKETDKNQTATSYLGWLWFGTTPGCPQGFKANEYIQSIHAVLSSYKPAPQIVELARKDKGLRTWYQNAKPAYLYEQPAYCKQDFYVSENFTLGNLVTAYGGYTGASYAIVPWRLIIRKDDLCPYEIGGGGRYRDAWGGQMRAPFTQTVQYKNTLIIMTKVPADFSAHYQQVTDIIEQWKKDWATDWAARHPRTAKDNVVNMVDGTKCDAISYVSLPSALKAVRNGNQVLYDAGKVIIAISCLRTPTVSTRAAESGRQTVQDKGNGAELTALALEVVEKSDVATVDELKTAIATHQLTKSGDATVTYTTLGGDRLEATFQGYGTCMEPLFDWGYGAKEPMCLMAAPPFRQPEWPTADGFGKIPAFSVNGRPVDYDATDRPVYSGDLLTLDKGILTVKTTDKYYVVDYSDDTPRWSEQQAEATDVGSRPFDQAAGADATFRADGVRTAATARSGIAIVKQNGKTKKIITR